MCLTLLRTWTLMLTHILYAESAESQIWKKEILTILVLLGSGQARNTERVAFPIIFCHFNFSSHSAAGNSTACNNEKQFFRTYPVIQP